ncbi:MAG: WG repeat-containing protein [Alistipes sp.]
MLRSILGYLQAVGDSHGLTKTLGDIDVCRDAAGRIMYSTGNSAVVFKIHSVSGDKMLKCYTRPPRYLAEIYGDRLLRDELFLFTGSVEGRWVDVVMDEWVEGETLHEAIVKASATGNTVRLTQLATAFDTLAMELLSDERAHGDLKPENIIVTVDGTLRLIDFDARYLPIFAGEQSTELGTAAFQHPARTAMDFDASLDDYPIALISTALHALSLDPTLQDRHKESDGLLFDPQQIHTSKALAEVLTLFEKQGLALRYRIAQLLYAPIIRLFGLKELIGYGLHKASASPAETEMPELFVESGRWGFRTTEHIVIPPIYDCGFDFSDSLAAVRIAQTWHYIDLAGRVAINGAAFEAIKPFNSGRAKVCRNHEWLYIDTCGRTI